MGAEMAKSSIYSKKTILDVIARLKNRGICNVELQKAAQEFISTRIEVYSSDLLVLQYSVQKGEKKGEFSYRDIPSSYLVVIMKDSPSKFRENPHIIHYKEITTDTGIRLDSTIKVVYIEAGKCYNYYQKNGRYPEGCEEIGPWLCAVADINQTRKAQQEQKNPDIEDICRELESFGQSGEVLTAMFKEKYAEINRNSEILQARDEGILEGKMEGIALDTIGLVQKKILKGKSIEVIADELERTVESIRAIYEVTKDNPGKTCNEIYEVLYGKAMTAL